VNRVGTKHVCVIDGDVLEFETITNDFGPDRIAYGEHLPRNAFVDDFAAYYVLEAAGTGTRLRYELHFRPKPFPRRFLAPLVRLRFNRLVPSVLAAIKESAESDQGHSLEPDRSLVPA
jgi:hypothetical protein